MFAFRVPWGVVLGYLCAGEEVSFIKQAYTGEKHGMVPNQPTQMLADHIRWEGNHYNHENAAPKDEISGYRCCMSFYKSRTGAKSMAWKEERQVFKNWLLGVDKTHLEPGKPPIS